MVEGGEGRRTDGKQALSVILIVEDNEMNRDMLSRRLQRHGYTVLVAETGEQGIELARTQRPRLILMDISLPGIDGWEATRVLKADAKTSGIPIIALTAHAMSTDREKAAEAGCNEFETKPVEFRGLVQKIEALLNRAA